MKNCLLILLFAMASLTVSSQAFTISKFDVDMSIEADGALTVVETIDVEFHKQRRGILRNIPYRYSFENQTLSVDIDNISVDQHQYQVSTKGRDKVIRIGSPDVYIDGKQSYTIRYTVKYPIIQHDRYQELYWNVTGDEWPTGIEAAAITVHLPRALALASDDMKVWTGKTGSKEQLASISQSDIQTFTAVSQRPIPAGEGMTIAMKMPYDYLAIPEGKVISSGSESPSGPHHDKPWWVLLPLGMLAGILQLWKSMRSKEIQPKYDKLYEAYPPEGLTSAHVGAFIDHQVHTRDVMSLIPYWAAEGYLSMSYHGELTLHKKAELPPSFPEYERQFFQALFEQSDTVHTAQMQGSLAGQVSKTKAAIDKEISYQDYYDEAYTDIWKSWKTVLMVIAPILAGILTIIFLKMIWLGVALILLGVAIIILSAYAPPLTPKGKELMARLEAFQRFVKDSPSDYLSEAVDANPKYFDQILPFAIAFGVDKTWLKHITPLMTDSPLWYEDQHGGSFVHFGNHYDSQALQKSFSVPPAPVSSGGGFSSGGSSGGGFGGGGGGSW